MLPEWELARMTMELSPFEDVLEDVRRGIPVVIIDDRERENEGDLMVAAEKITSHTVNRMLFEAKGLICMSLTEERMKALALPFQVAENRTTFGTNFGVSFDHISVVGWGETTTGRVKTIRSAAGEDLDPAHFVSPGYVFPVCAVPGGVFRRRGQTEGSVDLARLAGLRPAGVICEIMGSDGVMLRGEALVDYCCVHGLKITSVEEIKQYRLHHEVSLVRMGEMSIGEYERLASLGDLSESGKRFTSSLRVIIYGDEVDDKQHLAFVEGRPEDGCLVRIHSECLTGDIFSSRRCDCGNQFDLALSMILKEKKGVLIYLQQEGRDIGLGNKLRAYQLQDGGLDTVDANLVLGFAADSRDYRAAAQMLLDLGVRAVRLMTNNPSKVESLESFGVKVIERVHLSVKMDEFNKTYLTAKRQRLGHLI